MKKPKKRFKRKVKDAKIRPNRNWKNRKKKTSWKKIRDYPDPRRLF